MSAGVNKVFGKVVLGFEQLERFTEAIVWVCIPTHLTPPIKQSWELGIVTFEGTANLLVFLAWLATVENILEECSIVPMRTRLRLLVSFWRVMLILGGLVSQRYRITPWISSRKVLMQNVVSYV